VIPFTKGFRLAAFSSFKLRADVTCQSPLNIERSAARHGVCRLRFARKLAQSGHAGTGPVDQVKLIAYRVLIVG